MKNFITVTNYDGQPILINPTQIAFVEQTDGHAKISMAPENGQHIIWHTIESFDEVCSMIRVALSK